MRLKRTLAITLRAYDFSETSQVLHLYTREHGKIHCIAKGAKRRKSSFRGAFDVLCLYDVIRLEKHTGAMDVLTQAEPLKEWRGVRRDLGRFAAACYAVELVDAMTQEGLPQPELFDLLRASLDRLERGDPLPDVVFAFEARAVHLLGYLPRTEVCGSCGKRLVGPDAWLSPLDGGVVCASCPQRDPARVKFRRPVFDAIAALGAGRSFNLSITRSFIADLRRAFDLWIRWLQQGRELKSAGLMREAVLGAVARAESRPPAPGPRR